MRKKLYSAAAITLVASALLAGCGSSNSRATQRQVIAKKKRIILV